MERYESYKDSGIEWIGKIPSHWRIIPLKRIMQIRNGQDYKLYTDNDRYPVIGSGGCFAYCSRFLYDGEALLLGRKGTIDKPLYIKGRFWVVDTMFYAVPKIALNVRYCYYQALTIPFDKYSTSTALPSMTQTDLGYHIFCLPPFVEQQAIVAYLDKRCSEIDKAIATQQKRIALLQELKQSIITRAVTQGIHPDVPLKDSGVEWIGKVPEHWEVAFLKRYCSIKTGSTPSTKESKFYDSEDINWFTPGDFQSDILFDSNKKISDFARACNACKIFPARSIYMIGIGGTIGKIAVCNEIASANQQINIIIPNRKVYYKYVHYCLTSQKEEIILSANVVTLPIINQDKTGYLLLPIPPLNEQEDIVAYIEYRCKSIDRFISKAKRQIELLQELKQSVITEAITGKIKVC